MMEVRGKENGKRKKRFRQFGAFLLSLALLLGLFSGAGVKSEVQAATGTWIKNLQKAKVGDTVTFGSYEQDNDTSNGTEKIEWIVLAKKNGKALLISKYILDAKPYNEEWEAVTWENCTLRAFLNKDFYNAAFSASEKKRIVKTKVKNPDNSKYYTEGGNATKDKVFLLSLDEAGKYFSFDSERQAYATAYAKANGVAVNDWASSASDGFGYSAWCLRSPGSNGNCAAHVHSVGELIYSGSRVYDTKYGVRPALWVNLES